jgi:hypothetical protein
VAEGARLESVYAGNRIEGSNPSPSANYLYYHIENIMINNFRYFCIPHNIPLMSADSKGIFRSLRFFPRVHRYILEGGLNRVRQHGADYKFLSAPRARTLATGSVTGLDRRPDRSPRIRGRGS